MAFTDLCGNGVEYVFILEENEASNVSHYLPFSKLFTLEDLNHHLSTKALKYARDYNI